MNTITNLHVEPKHLRMVLSLSDGTHHEIKLNESCDIGAADFWNTDYKALNIPSDMLMQVCHRGTMLMAKGRIHFLSEVNDMFDLETISTISKLAATLHTMLGKDCREVVTENVSRW